VIARVCLLAALLAAASVALPAQEQPAPTRAIVNVTGQLYRAQNDRHFTVFLVTPSGIILSDPINRDFANWLKGQFAVRFKVPVRYVLYTHSDWDHASGGAVFAETAEFIAHEQFRTALSTFHLTMANNGGKPIEDGDLSDVYPPSSTFSARYTVMLAGKRAEMIPVGPAHTSDSAVVYFPDERAIFSADVLQVKRLPGNIVPNVGTWVSAYRTIMSIDFDHALTGHGLAGTKKDAGDMQRFFDDLSTGVAAGIGAGGSLLEIQKTLTLDAYKGFERWDTHRQTHIAAVYATMKGGK
jgi:glyoxylase-like metal-dependent hydrolase (beta-lactamase superfamily II)